MQVPKTNHSRLERLHSTPFGRLVAVVPTTAGLRLVLFTALLMTVVSSCGPSGPTGVPTPPRDVVATAIPGGVNVNWVDQSSDEQGFIVLRKAAGADGPPGEEIGRVGADEISYNDFPTDRDGAYVYAVQSFNVIGASDPVTQSPGDPVTPLPGVDVMVTFDGDGTVVISGGAVSKTCADDCLVAFAAGTDVTFSAKSAEGEVFAGWAGDCSGAGDCEIEIDEPVEIEARFRKHVLQLSLAGDSPVRLTMYPADDFGNIQCELARGDECALAYGFEGPLAVSINAEKLDAAGTFNGFDGPCTTTSPFYCLVNVEGATSVAIQSVHPPVATGEAYASDEDQTLEVSSPGVLGNDEDSADDELSAVLVEGPTNGDIDLKADGSFSYTPTADYNGTDAFTYLARDLYGNESEPVTVSLSIAALNDPPVFDLSTDSFDAGPANGSPRGQENFATGIDPGGGSDEDAQVVTFTVNKVSGDLTAMAVEPQINPLGTLAFLPAFGSHGVATYEVTLSDNGGGDDTSEPQQFTIEVTSYTLTTSVVGQGTIAPANVDGEYGWNASISLTATAAVDYAFGSWTGPCTSRVGNTCNVTMTEDRSFTAIFHPFVSVVIPPGTPTVTVTSDPGDINCSSAFLGPKVCTRPIAAGTVTLSLDIMTPLFFDGVVCSGGEPTTACAFEVSGPLTVTLRSPPP